MIHYSALVVGYARRSDVDEHVCILNVLSVSLVATGVMVSKNLTNESSTMDTCELLHCTV